MAILTTDGLKSASEVYQKKAKRPKLNNKYNKPRKRDRYLYVLELEDNYYYVGQTVDVQKRVEQHKSGQGAKFTKRHKFIRIAFVDYVGKVTAREAGYMEDKLTIEWAMKYGPSNVRGGSYCGESAYAIIKAMNS